MLNTHIDEKNLRMKAGAADRAQLLKKVFPAGVPVLWCPPLTHYDQDGRIDAKRITTHLAHLARHVKAFLIPGSTGDGWELSDEEARQVLEIALGHSRELEFQVLIGALKPETADVLNTLNKTIQWLKTRTQQAEIEQALAMSRVCGFAVCAARGKSLSQEEIGCGLASVLELGLPTALYQLPQVTQNEIGPDLAANLAARFQNFIAFKDSSGADRVVLSGKDLRGVCALRGAEGDYTRWSQSGGGSYYGFLLASANCFAAELSEILVQLAARRPNKVQELSQRVSATVAAVMELVRGLPKGNAFANANRALDHFFAYGPNAAAVPPPTLHGGDKLPAEVLRATEKILLQYQLMPKKGYLG